VKLMENAVAQLPGGAGAGSRRISGRTIDISLGPDGSTVTSLAALENVQVDIPATANAPARRINAQSLAAGGASGLQTATFTGGVRFRETRPAQPGAPAGERTADSLRLVIETQPGLGEIQQADFRGNVRIVDGETTAEGPQAIYRVAQDSFDVVPGTGDPGPPPSVNDGKVLVNARTITIAIGTKKLRAETDVRSSMQPSQRTDKSPGPARGRAGNGPADTKMPSVFKQDEVINATSNRLEYDGAAARATYTGNAKLFQGQTRIQADAITVDDRTANLNASGKVVTVMFLEETDSKTKARQLVQTTATGDTMVYEDAKRLATYKTGPSASAHVVGTQGDVTGDQIQLFLKQGVNELERAEADGHVTVKEGYRTATGNHLTYTAADETYVMNGTPVEIEEKTPTECRVTTTSQVTFMRSAVSTTIRNNGVSPNATRPCIAR
jgi:lipopolysaccharide export system protein LptA